VPAKRCGETTTSNGWFIGFGLRRTPGVSPFHPPAPLARTVFRHGAKTGIRRMKPLEFATLFNWHRAPQRPTGNLPASPRKHRNPQNTLCGAYDETAAKWMETVISWFFKNQIDRAFF
jgi:hypothetical protein